MSEEGSKRTGKDATAKLMNEIKPFMERYNKRNVILTGTIEDERRTTE